MNGVFDGVLLGIGRWITYGTQTSNTFAVQAVDSAGNRSPTKPHARQPELLSAGGLGYTPAAAIAARGWAIASRAVGIERFDRVPLLFGPSPVHRLERLSEHLGGAVDIWAKREDCNSGLAYGGNKVRKLEYLAADASRRGATRSSRSAACSRTTPVR